MERRHLRARALAAALGVAAGAGAGVVGTAAAGAGAASAAAPASAAGTGVSWVVLGTGATTPAGRSPAGYVAVTRAPERRFAARLEPQLRADLRRVNLARTGLVAVFLDGMPCGSHLGVGDITRTATTLTVRLRYTRPPLGAGACVRTSTPSFLIGVSRRTLGRPVPQRIRVIAVARA